MPTNVRWKLLTSNCPRSAVARSGWLTKPQRPAKVPSATSVVVVSPVTGFLRAIVPAFKTMAKRSSLVLLREFSLYQDIYSAVLAKGP